MREATVVCRMLGFPNASYAIKRFPASDGYFCFLQYLKCNGDESTISECSNSGLEVSESYCSDYSVGVVCGNPKRKCIIMSGTLC